MSETRDDFIGRYGHLFEHSPWVVEQAWRLGPFQGREDLHAAFMRVLEDAGEPAQLALVRAHPQLADKAAITLGLTQSSADEQASAGLTQLTASEFDAFHALNRGYLDRFGFPFVICVRLHDKAGILAAMRARLTNDAATELKEAIAQIGLISRLRLDQIPEAAP